LHAVKHFHEIFYKCSLPLKKSKVPLGPEPMPSLSVDEGDQPSTKHTGPGRATGGLYTSGCAAEETKTR
jgi:hypothetical protein